jgi:hypothetical protein
VPEADIAAYSIIRRQALKKLAYHVINIIRMQALRGGIKAGGKRRVSGFGSTVRVPQHHEWAIP